MDELGEFAVCFQTEIKQRRKSTNPRLANEALSWYKSVTGTPPNEDHVDEIIEIFEFFKETS